MNNFLRRLLNYDTVDALIAIGYGHMEIIEGMREQMAYMNLESARYHRALLEQFLIELDHPEHEEKLRETLAAAIFDLNDEIARIEEHVS